MVVKANVLLGSMLHLLGRVKRVEMETLGFKMAEKVLHGGIIPAVSLSGHTSLYTVSLKQSRSGSLEKFLCFLQIELGLNCFLYGYILFYGQCHSTFSPPIIKYV
ncbi:MULTISPECIES: hypothetical protein [Paenibacillus]|uniref:hypothetical protein n=1 Tax=Paenibacillus TaxID=44249 RepID=UPI002FE39D51